MPGVHLRIECNIMVLNLSIAVLQLCDNAKEFLKENPDVSEPLTYDGFLKEKLKEVIGYHMDIFGKERR